MVRLFISLGFLTCIFISSHAVAADVNAGRKVAAKCNACHTLERGGAHKIGPNLFGVTARRPGTAQGYRYSPAFLKGASTLSWNEGTLSEYLTDPTAFLQRSSGDSRARSKMTIKLKSEQERRNVIAFLNTLR